MPRKNVVVIVSRWYMEDDSPTILEAYLFEKEITKEQFLDLYPSYKNDYIQIEFALKGE